MFFFKKFGKKIDEFKNSNDKLEGFVTKLLIKIKRLQEGSDSLYFERLI